MRENLCQFNHKIHYRNLLPFPSRMRKSIICTGTRAAIIIGIAVLVPKRLFNHILSIYSMPFGFPMDISALYSTIYRLVTRVLDAIVQCTFVNKRRVNYTIHTLAVWSSARIAPKYQAIVAKKGKKASNTHRLANLCNNTWLLCLLQMW